MICLLMYFSSLLFIAGVAKAEPIAVLTEIDPPFQEMEGDRVGGRLTHLVRQLFFTANLSEQIEAKPWARSYTEALTTPNTGLFPVIRTPEREPFFSWIGPILIAKQGLYKLKLRSDIQLSKLGDAKRYNIGVLLGDARYAFMRKQGFFDFPDGGLHPVGETILNYRKLTAGRVDLIMMADVICTTGTIDCSALELALPIEELSDELYLCFRADSSIEIISKLLSAMETMKKSGEWEKLTKQILAHHDLPDEPEPTPIPR